MTSLKDRVLLFLKGIAMGSADAIPGVSGGTIALITGIYEKLINSIKAVDLEALNLLKDLEFRKFWKHINGSFLFTVISGIALSLISLARLITYLLENHEIQLWSFFFGLIIISSILVLREIKKWKLNTVLGLIIGITIAFIITEVTPATTPDDLWFIFISGAIAICAMILPGISGAFILLILGKYEYVYTALKNFNFPVILVFILGCITGILSFSRIISWLLKKFHNLAIAMLSGFMLGSLNKIWPWKVIIMSKEGPEGNIIPLVQENVLPGAFLRETGNDPFVLQAVLFMAIGILIVIAIEKASHNI